MTMLDVLSDWVRTVVLLLLFVAFVQLLIPEHPMREYVRMVLGLVVIAAVIGPLIGVLDPDTWVFRLSTGLAIRTSALEEAATMNDGTQTLIARGQSLARQARDRVEADAREQLHGRVRSLALLLPGVEAAAVETDWDDRGALAHMTVSIVTTPDAPGGIAERVRQAVSDLFDVPPSSVQVRVER